MSQEAEDGLEEFGRALARAGRRIEPLLRELFPPDDSDPLCGPFWRHMRSGGKRIRPALCLLCCEELGGDSEQALPFAAAVEVLHNMFLIHDDIEDGDTVRRDAEAVWVSYGLGPAINLGDYMLGRAYSAVLRSHVPAEVRLRLLEAFTDTYERTCRGQALDMELRGSEDLTLDAHMEMVTLKTGHYLALGMVGGAIVAGLGEEAVREIRNLGCTMGPAFQIRDDVLDLTQGKGRGGARGNDIREGKPSILYAHALATASAQERSRLLEVARKDRRQTTEQDVEWVLGLYERLGSVEFAQARAEELVARAFETIERIPVENKAFFRRAARFMALRSH